MADENKSENPNHTGDGNRGYTVDDAKSKCAKLLLGGNQRTDNVFPK